MTKKAHRDEMDYATIKAAAKKLGVSYKNLIALAPANDPFYVGTDGDMEKAIWFHEIWQRAGYTSEVHLRRVHYWAMSKADIWTPGAKSEIYSNTIKHWKLLCQASKLARYLGLIDYNDIIDNKNPDPHIFTDYNPDIKYGIDLPDLDNWHIDVWDVNLPVFLPYHLEVWVEKSTMNDILLPICRRYHANLVTFAGESSLTACNDLVTRAMDSNKPVRVFYIADFDPAGNSMPVAMSRKIEYLMSHRGADCDICVTPLALTLEQVKKYQIPRLPIKETEKRAGRFESAYGVGGAELDALEAIHPGSLSRIIRRALDKYFDHEKAQEVTDARGAMLADLRAKVDLVTGRYEAELNGIRGMLDELRSIQISISRHRPDTSDYEVRRGGEWLFDSERGYIEQVARYKAYKGGYSA